MMNMTATRGVVFWMVMLLGALTMWAGLSAHAADLPVQVTIVVPPTNTHGVSIETTAVIASGATEDTLTARMARIPEGANADNVCWLNTAVLGSPGLLRPDFGKSV